MDQDPAEGYIFRKNRREAHIISGELNKFDGVQKEEVDLGGVGRCGKYNQCTLCGIFKERIQTKQKRNQCDTLF